MTRYIWTDLSRIDIHASSTLHRIHSSTNTVEGYAAGEVRDGRVVLEHDPTGVVHVPIASLRSWNPIEDLAMRRAVQATRFPTLRYDLGRAGGGPVTFIVNGELTMHGVTLGFETDVTVAIEGGWLRVEGEHTFDVTEFGVTPPSLLGLRVHPGVRVVAHLVGREEK